MKNIQYSILTLAILSLIFNSCTNLFNSCTNSVSDIDGNKYDVVEIGNQMWMAENLRTSRFTNGDDIPNLVNDSDWNTTNNSKRGAWVHFDNNVFYETVYGKLYNWHAVNDNRGLCPEGWIVPTEEDWQELEIHLGMSNTEANSRGRRGAKENVGGKLKIEGTTYWTSPNVGATNESGFNGLPGSIRFNNGGFGYLGEVGVNGRWWSSTEAPSGAWSRSVYNDSTDVIKTNFNKQAGLSVRCIQK